MQVYSLILVLMAIGGIYGVFAIFMPAFRLMQKYHAEDMICQYPKLSVMTAFIMLAIFFPLALVSLVFPSVKDNFVDAFYQGLSGK